MLRVVLGTAHMMTGTTEPAPVTRNSSVLPYGLCMLDDVLVTSGLILAAKAREMGLERGAIGVLSLSGSLVFAVLAD